MSTVLEKTYTPEDLLAMPDRKSYELVDGHLVERNVSVLSSWVADGSIVLSTSLSTKTNSAGHGVPTWDMSVFPMHREKCGSRMSRSFARSVFRRD